MPRLIIILLVAGSALLSAYQVAAATVSFYSDQASFQAATGVLTLIDFEDIAPAGSHQLMVDYTEADVQFDSSSGGTNGIGIADAASTATFGGPYTSDILFANKSADLLLISLPGGVSAVGGEFGDLFAVADLQLTLVGQTSGVLSDQFFAAAPGLGSGATPNFYGWTVSGDSIASITVTGAFEAIDNFSLELPAVPEPRAWLLLAGVGIALAWRHRHGTQKQAE